MKRIFILGAFGQNNLGDDALLQVFLNQFRDAQLVVNSTRPADTAFRFGVKAVATYTSWPRFSRLRALLGSQMIIFGGGSLLKEIEGNHVARLLYFARIFFLLFFGKLMSRPTAMLGVGIGPLSRPFYKMLTRYAANLTDLICVRDTDSCDLLRAIGVTKPVHVTADSVFTLRDFETRANALELEQLTKSPFAVVVPRYSLTASQQAALAATCDHLVEACGLRILFLPFQTGYLPKYDDLPVTNAIHAQMRHSDAAQIWITGDPSAALAAIGKSDLVLSARLHGLIFAAMQGVASVAMSYEVKVRSFMAELGQPWAGVSLNDLEAGRLPAIVERAWDERAKTRETVSRRTQTLRAQAQRNFELAGGLESNRNLGTS